MICVRLMLLLLLLLLIVSTEELLHVKVIVLVE